MRRTRPSRLVPATALLRALVVALVALGLLTATESAAHADVGRPSGVRISAVSSSSFTVSLSAAADAQSYRMYESPVENDVTYNTITTGGSTSARKTVNSTTPSLTVTGLAYTTSVYYYRVVTINGASMHYSDIYQVGLKPSTPTDLTAHTGSSGTYLTWSAGSATGFVLAEATSTDFVQGRRDWVISGQTHQFTPYKLVKGQTYYFRVRGANDGTAGSYSAGYATVVPDNDEQIVRTLTFNILKLSSDGTSEGGQTVASWTSRRTVAAGLVKQDDPDVVAIQEGSDYTGSAAAGTRQVDSLVSAIGSSYALAQTEIAPPNPGYYRIGNYILYKPSVVEPVNTVTGPDTGGSWSLGDDRYAVYQLFQYRSTGARFLYTSSHLLPNLSGSAYDADRENETKSLLSQSTAYAAKYHVPVVYNGDFNSDTSDFHVYDGAGRAMAAVGNEDGQEVAQSYTNQSYDSSNQYLRTPPAFDQSIDKIYTQPGTAIYSWRCLVNLSHGSFVGTMASDHNPIYSTIVIPY